MARCCWATRTRSAKPSFYLPLNNGAYGFEWVSDMQVICVVHLKPSQGKNRTFTLPAADKKTVTEAMKKMKF